MATRYGYVSRDKANRQVNWGEIGKQVSDDIIKITQDRKTRKEDVLKQSKDYAKMLIEMPMGSNTAFNQYLSDFTSQASKASLADLQALKRGDISEQEYYNRRANLVSGTELMIAGANNFNKNYDVIQERIDSGIASGVEIKYRAKMAQLLEFGNRAPFINPDTREVNTARLAPSGLMETTVEDIASASDMFRISTFQLNKFDMEGAIESMKKNLGVQQFTDDKTGNTIKYDFNEALMSTDEIKQAKKELVSSYMKDDKAVISILADYVPDYDVTLDPFAVNDKTALIARDGSYEITKDQREAAEEYMLNRLESSLPRTEIEAISPKEERQLKIAEDQLAISERGAVVKEETLALAEKKLEIAIDQQTKAEKALYKPWNNNIFLPPGQAKGTETDITTWFVSEFGNVNTKYWKRKFVNQEKGKENRDKFLETVDSALAFSFEDNSRIVNRFNADNSNYEISIPGVTVISDGVNDKGTEIFKDTIITIPVNDNPEEFINNFNAIMSLIVGKKQAGQTITQEEVNSLFGIETPIDVG